METLELSFLWPWVGPEAENMTNMGPGMVLGLGTGIPLPGTHPAIPHPGYTSSLPVRRQLPDMLIPRV